MNTSPLLYTSAHFTITVIWADPEGGGGVGKSQTAIGFLRNTGTDHPRAAIGLYGPYTKEHIYVLVIVWIVRLYGKIIHELL